jgi:hypothetical protein
MMRTLAMIRSIYRYLVELHPYPFRQRFGEQMLSTFDDASRERSAFHLVIDAFFSMLRQRLFRSEFQSRSEQLQRKARLGNLAWTLAVVPLQVIAALLVNPANRTMSAQVFYSVLPVFLFLALHHMLSRRVAGPIDEYGLVKGTRSAFRAELERRLDSLRLWSEQMGRVLILTMLTLVSVAIAGSLLGGKPPAGSVWLIADLIVFAIQTVTFFTFLKRINERAAQTLQEEIGTLSRATGQLSH